MIILHNPSREYNPYYYVDKAGRKRYGRLCKCGTFIHYGSKACNRCLTPHTLSSSALLLAYIKSRVRISIHDLDFSYVSHNNLRVAACRLTKKGLLQHVGKGLYIKGPKYPGVFNNA